MPATDHRIDGYPFTYPVVIDFVADGVDAPENCTACYTGNFCKGV